MRLVVFIFFCKMILLSNCFGPETDEDIIISCDGEEIDKNSNKITTKSTNIDLKTLFHPDGRVFNYDEEMKCWKKSPTRKIHRKTLNSNPSSMYGKTIQNRRDFKKMLKPFVGSEKNNFGFDGENTFLNYQYYRPNSISPYYSNQGYIPQRKKYFLSNYGYMMTRNPNLLKQSNSEFYYNSKNYFGSQNTDDVSLDDQDTEMLKYPKYYLNNGPNYKNDVDVYENDILSDNHQEREAEFGLSQVNLENQYDENQVNYLENSFSDQDDGNKFKAYRTPVLYALNFANYDVQPNQDNVMSPDMRFIMTENQESSSSSVNGGGFNDNTYDNDQPLFTTLGFIHRYQNPPITGEVVDSDIIRKIIQKIAGNLPPNKVNNIVNCVQSIVNPKTNSRKSACDESNSFAILLKEYNILEKFAKDNLNKDPYSSKTNFMTYWDQLQKRIKNYMAIIMNGQNQNMNNRNNNFKDFCKSNLPKTISIDINYQKRKSEDDDEGNINNPDYSIGELGLPNRKILRPEGTYFWRRSSPQNNLKNRDYNDEPRKALKTIKNIKTMVDPPLKEDIINNGMFHKKNVNKDRPISSRRTFNKNDNFLQQLKLNRY